MRISDWSSDVCSSDLKLRGGEVLDRGAHRLEDGDLVVVAPSAALAARQLQEVAGNVLGSEHPRLHGLPDFSALLGRPGAGIYEHTGAAHPCLVALAHFRAEGPHAIPMLAGLHPPAPAPGLPPHP